MPHKCSKIETNNCPTDSYKDEYGAVCQPISIMCTNRTAINGRCQFKCNDGYKLFKSGNNQFDLDANNFIGAHNEADCLLASDTNTTFWSINQSELQNYFCRRINDPPRNMTLSSSTILEYSPQHTKIGVLSVVDDSSQTITFTIEESEGSNQFQIEKNILQNTDILSLKTMNYKDSIKVKIRATDDGIPLMFSEKEFIIKILNVNEPPEDIRISNDVITDKTRKGSIIGTLSAIDPDLATNNRLSSKLNWALTDNKDHFQLKGANIILSKLINRTGDFLFTLNITCSDLVVPPLTSTATVFIQYRDNNVHPSNLTLAMRPLLENTTARSTVGQIRACDEENHDIVFTVMSPEETKETFDISSIKCTSSALQKCCVADLGIHNLFVTNFLLVRINML